MSISMKDRELLRDLARQQAELAASPRNRQLYQDWMDYGSSQTPVVRPLIRIEINTFEHEILPSLMKCEGEEARRIEARMLRPMINFTRFEDDTLVPDYYGIEDHTRFVPFGLQVKKQEYLMDM